MAKEHNYNLTIQWTGNLGKDTLDYHSYDRSHIISSSGKPQISGSSDPHFRGDISKYNPEELFLASISSCHMLWFLHLCSDRGILVEKYVDYPIGCMVTDASGGGKFKNVTLNPYIKLKNGSIIAKTIDEIHAKAHKLCFIANSVNFPIQILTHQEKK